MQTQDAQAFVESVEGSATNQLDRSKSMTEVVFQLDWKELFPIRLQNNETIDVISYEAASQFLRENIEKCFEGQTIAFDREEDQVDRRDRYYRLIGDFFGLFCNGSLVGVFVGNIDDWSSYYLRFSAILPEFRGGDRYRVFFRSIENFLRDSGVGRIRGQISPLNKPSFLSVTSLGYICTGLDVTDRWGTVMNFSKELQNERRFRQRFFTNDSEINSKQKEA